MDLDVIGLISQGLAAHTRQIVGVDISQGMVNEYNQRVTNQGIPTDEMKALCLDVLEEGDCDSGVSEETLKALGGKFDVVVVRCFILYHRVSIC